MSYPLPIINLDTFLSDPTSPDAQAQADELALGLITYGAIIVKDSRYSEEENDAFLNLMEDYFAQPDSIKKKDERPEWHYQAGVTLEGTEKPKCGGVDSACKAFIDALDPDERPMSMQAGHADPKARFFWRCGLFPPETKFDDLNIKNVTPEAFKDTWPTLMDGWGKQLQQACETVSFMLARGLGLSDSQSIVNAAKYGPHLLAPTATDLIKYGRLGEVFAGFHSDLNFISCHGRSRVPGLHLWCRNTGKRLSVKLPPGHLLLQAGKQLEHLSSGLILAGFHEVVATQATLDALAHRKAQEATRDRPAIRISSTFFFHLSSDYQIKPKDFEQDIKPSSELVRKKVEECVSEGGKEYEVTYVGDLVMAELRAINLSHS